MIDWTKPVRTKEDHYHVNIWKIDKKVFGSYIGLNGEEMEEIAADWTLDGRFFSIQNRKSSLDLENIPEDTYVWFNVYEDEEGLYTSEPFSSKSRCEFDANNTIKTIVGRHKVKLEKGRFDES